MRRVTNLLCSALALGVLPAVALGQWSENFDSYSPGPLIPQSNWEAWDQDPGASNFDVSTAQAHSAPNSVAIDGVDDAVYLYSGYGSGAWSYTTWVWVPSDFSDVQAFILLNTYNHGGLKEWSHQMSFDGLNNLVTVSEIAGPTLPLAKGVWAEVKVVINLSADEQWVWYNGALLGTDDWTQGATPANIGSVDLWGNGSGHLVYYDDMSIAAAVTTGACCFIDGSCTEDNTQAGCEAAGGTFAGPDTTCATANCPVPGVCGWIMEGPGIFQGDTCIETPDCALKPSKDAQFEVTLPYDADWTFSVCSATWDTVLYVGIDCCTNTWMSDDAPGCGAASELTIPGLTAGTYYVTLEGFSQSTCGAYTFEVTSPCIVPCPPGSLDEQEPCGQELNDGCNQASPAFMPIAGGDVYCGEIHYDGAAVQDGDWYEIVLTEPTELTFVVEAEFPVLMGLAITTTPGSGDCSQYENSIGPFSTTTTCGQIAFINTDCLDPGTYWLIVTANWQLGQIIECGSGSQYFATLTTETCGGTCPEDVNGDNVVNVLDLLLVLAAWDATSGPEDINGDGVVNVLDLLLVLGAWGPC